MQGSLFEIDLHVHTRERSACARSSTDAMIRAAIESGLDGMAITDHDRFVPPDRLAYLGAKYAPFRVLGGIEVTTLGEHVLVLGVQDEILEEGWWSYSDLHDFVVARDGFLCVAHPFRFNGRRIDADLEGHPPHALEIYSHNTPRLAASRISQLGGELEASLLSDSDAHRANEVGCHYNVLEEEPRDIDELVRMLKAGAIDVVAPDS